MKDTITSWYDQLRNFLPRERIGAHDEYVHIQEWLLALLGAAVVALVLIGVSIFQFIYVADIYEEEQSAVGSRTTFEKEKLVSLLEVLEKRTNTFEDLRARPVGAPEPQQGRDDVPAEVPTEQETTTPTQVISE